MSVRLMQNINRWQFCQRIVQRLNFHTNKSSYAICICRQPKENPIKNWTNHKQFTILPASTTTAKCININYSTKAAIREDTPTTTTTTTTPSVDNILSTLQIRYERKGYVNVEYFQKLLELLEKEPNIYNQFLTKEQTLFLLGACGGLMPTHSVAERMQLFQRLWQYLAQNNQLTVEHYRSKLQVLQYNRTPLSDHNALLNELIALDSTAITPQLYAELLEVACHCGNIRQATDIVAEMRTHKFALTERNFDALFLGYALAHDLDGCQSVIDSMTAAGVPMSTETNALHLIAYLENNSVAKATEILKKYHRQFSVAQILKILRSALYINIDLELIVDLVHELPTEYVTAVEVPVALRNICIELIHSGKLPTTLQIIATLPQPIFNENQDTDTFGAFLLPELFHADVDTERILEICKMLCESEKNKRALHIAADIATRLSPPKGLPYLEALAMANELLRPHYFWPLMMYNRRRHGEIGIVKTLTRMKDLNVACDELTIRQYVLPNIWVMMEDPVQALRTLDTEGGVRAAQVLTPLIVHLLTVQRLDDITRLLDLYPTKLDLSPLIAPLSNLSATMRATKRFYPYCKVVAALAAKSNNPKIDFIGQLLMNMLTMQPRLRSDLYAIQRFVGGMQKFDLTISSAALDSILSMVQQPKDTDAANGRYGDISKMLHKMSTRSVILPQAQENSPPGSSSPSSFIKHPRDMTRDELECHLIELEAKGLNTRGVLRRLLQVSVRDGQLDRALELKHKCDELKVQVSPGMLASIFDMYIKLKDLRNAEESLKRLQEMYPGFLVDEHKIIDYAALLVHMKQFETGKKVLENRAATQRIIGGDYVIKNVWNFLTNVAHWAAANNATLLKETNLTRETFGFLQQLHYCKPHNSLLGPIVRERLLRNDICGAIDEFRQLADQYKYTPLQFELFSLLVRLSNGHPNDLERFPITMDEAQRLLSDLTSIVTRVHGVTNMNSALLLAFAESGTDTQLRRLMMNPEFRINHELLVKNCEHLGKEGSVATLLRLARCARGLNHVIDEQSIYNMLLSNFARANDYEAALDLFDRLQCDDELKISQEFLRNLVNLLKVNNIEIPSGVALRAQII